MDALKIDATVLTADGTYSMVYAFVTQLPKLRLNSSSSVWAAWMNPLKFRKIYSKDHNNYAIFRPAGQVKMGDLLATQQGLLPARVKSIHEMTRCGAYPPFAAKGDIAVDGIIASNYMSLPLAFQDLVSFEQHLRQHAAYAYRLYCRLVGCMDDTYNKATGLSNAVTMWLPILHWLESHSFVLL